MPRLEQRPDGTWIRVLNPTEAALFNKLAQETTDRKESDGQIIQRFDTLSNAHLALIDTVNNVQGSLTTEQNTRATGDKTLQEQIDILLKQTPEASYSKGEINKLISLWKVEEIDVPYTVPLNSLFDNISTYKIREGYYFGEDTYINIPKGQYFQDNVVRRYTIWAMMNAATDVAFTFQYDGDITVYINNYVDELGENTYANQTTATYSLKEGWNRIQILYSHEIGEAGLYVKHTLNEKATALACLDYRAGSITSDMIGPAIIQPAHLNQTASFKVRQLVAESDSEPGVVVGNGSVGSFKVGNALVTKGPEGLRLNCPLIVETLQTVAEAETIDNRMNLFIDPKNEDFLHAIDFETVEDSGCFGGQGFKVIPGVGYDNAIIVGDIDNVLRYGTWAISIRMKVAANNSSDPALIIRTHANGAAPIDNGIPMDSFANTGKFQLVGLTIPYTAPGVNKAGFGVDLVFTNKTEVVIDYISMTLTTPVAVELPKHNHNDLYMKTEDVEAAVQVALDDITTEISTRAEADSDLQDQINTLSTNIGSVQTGTSNAIAAETSTRESADTSLQNQINTVVENVSTINTNLADEITARTDVDTAFADDITALTNNLSSEITARVDADALINQTLENKAAKDHIHTPELATDVSLLPADKGAGAFHSALDATTGELELYFAVAGDPDSSIPTIWKKVTLS